MLWFNSAFCSGDLDPAVLSLRAGHEQLAAVRSAKCVLVCSSFHIFASEELSVGLMPSLPGACANQLALKMFSLVVGH